MSFFFFFRNHKPKTKVVFSPSDGIIKIEQKLPFPWHAFNETPTYEVRTRSFKLKINQALGGEQEKVEKFEF